MTSQQKSKMQANEIYYRFCELIKYGQHKGFWKGYEMTTETILTEEQINEQERAAFEVDCLERHPTATFGRFPISGQYNINWVEHQWVGYQAGRAAIKDDRQRRSELVKVSSDDDSLTIAYMSGYLDGKRYTIPEGWQLVPKVPTKEMLLAGKHTIKGADTTFEGILAEYAYLSMLEAAPKFEEE